MPFSLYMHVSIWGLTSNKISIRTLCMVGAQPRPPNHTFLVNCMAADRLKTLVSSIPRHSTKTHEPPLISIHHPKKPHFFHFSTSHFVMLFKVLLRKPKSQGNRIIINGRCWTPIFDLTLAPLIKTWQRSF